MSYPIRPFLTDRDRNRIAETLDTVAEFHEPAAKDLRARLSQARSQLQALEQAYAENPRAAELDAQIRTIADLPLEQRRELIEERTALQASVEEQRDYIRRLEGQLDDVSVNQGADQAWEAYAVGKLEGFKLGIRHTLELAMAMMDDTHASNLLCRIAGQEKTAGSNPNHQAE